MYWPPSGCLRGTQDFTISMRAEDGQYRPKHVVIHYIVIKYTSCDTVVFDYIQFPKFHTHNEDDTLPRPLSILDVKDKTGVGIAQSV